MKKQMAMEALIEIRVPVIVFHDEDERMWYAHCPALDITGYGTTQKEASNSFAIVLEETIEYMIAHGTLHDELLTLGWSKTQERLTPPPMETLLWKSKDLRRMMACSHSLSYSPLPAIA